MSAGSTLMSARVSSPSSRSSGVVNAACAGPRRPSKITYCTPQTARPPTAAAADDDLMHAAARQAVDRVVGGVGHRDLVGIEHEHARDVDRDVAVADHD